MAKLLLGKPVREKMALDLRAKVVKMNRSPVLAIVQVGEREDSSAYIKQKQKFGEEIGVEVILKNLNIERLKNGEGEENIIKVIEELNQDKKVDGIIVQLPLENFDTEKIINSISKEKDADGLRQSDIGGEVLVTPATARAVMALLDFYKIEVQDKKVTVVGRSRLAGGPIAIELEKRGAMVQICHKGTENTRELCVGSDILVVAAGQIGLITKDFVHKDQVVIDVGINRPHPSLRVDPLLVKEREEQTKPSLPKLVGDVDFAEVELIVAAISPVPGGVGPLTVACLFENLLDLCYTD